MSATATPGTQIVTGELHRVRRGTGKGFSAETPPEPSASPTRIAVMLALAHKIWQAIDRGEIKDQAEAARMLGVTRARITQILDLTLLAPSVQEAALFCEHAGPSSTDIRRAARIQVWADQRNLLRSVGTR